MTTIKKPLLLLISFFLLNSHINAQIVLEKIYLLDNKIEIQVPKGFSLMSSEMIASQFPPVGDIPNAHWAITDQRGDVNLAYNYTPITIDDNHIPGYADVMMATLKRERNDLKFLDDGVLLQDGKNIGYIAFLSEWDSKRVFNFLFYISFNDRLLVFNLICKEQLRTTWEAKAEEIANSIRVKS